MSTLTAATSDQVALLFCEETTFGVLETTPTMIALRITGESLGQETNVTESNELVTDRQIADLIRIAVAAPGDINFELSYGVYDSLFKAALMSAAWSADVDIAAGDDIAFNAPSGNTQTITTDGASFGVLTVGMWVRITGAASDANNGIFKIESITSAGEMAVYNASGVSAIASTSVAFKQGGQIVNGTTDVSFNFEREYSDLSSEFAQYLGIQIDGMTINIQADQLITGSLNVVGNKEQSASSTNANSVTAAPTNTPMNAIDNVDGIYENNALLDMSAFAINTRNNLRDRNIIGTLGAAGRGAGKFNCSGTMQKFFESKTVMDKYLDQTVTSMGVVCQDGAGNGYVFDMPQMKFLNGKRVAGGINTDIVADMAWQAYKDPTLGITLRIQRFPV